MVRYVQHRCSLSRLLSRKLCSDIGIAERKLLSMPIKLKEDHVSTELTEKR